MSGQASQRFGLAGLARATQRSLSWANFGQGDKKAAPAKHEASNEAIDRLIEAEIIPRLMLNNRAAAEDLSPDAAANSSTRFEPGDIDAFARKAVIKDPEELVAEVYRLAGSGLLYLHARYANPTTGSFLSQDPVQGVIGGASVTFNPYPYAHNNPVNMVDPNGEFLTCGLYFDEALIVQAIDLNQIHRTRSRLPLLRDERPHLIQRELARILTENNGE